MNYQKLKDINLSTDMMDASQVSSFTEDTYQHLDYSAIEVYPTSTVIAAGTTDKDTGLRYSVDVPSCDTAYIEIKVDCPKESCDVVIDWGDGSNKTIIKNEKLETEGGDIIRYGTSGTNRDVDIKHKYVVAGKKYIIKIYGTYKLLRGYFDGYETNIISRCLDWDLPIAACVQSINSIAHNSKKLLKVSVPRFFQFKNLSNIGGLFSNCENLKTVSLDANSDYYNHEFKQAYNIFGGCTNLETSNWRLPHAILEKSYNSFYSGCKNLVSNIESLMPINGFFGRTVSMSDTFSGCAKLTGNVYNVANLLWDDKNLIITGNPFAFNDPDESATRLLSTVLRGWTDGNCRGTWQKSKDADKDVVIEVEVSENDEIECDIYAEYGSNAMIIWGDNSHSHVDTSLMPYKINRNLGDVPVTEKHKYNTAGVFQIRLVNVRAFSFQNKLGRDKVKKLISWGTNLSDDIRLAFCGCSNLTEICNWYPTVRIALNVFEGTGITTAVPWGNVSVAQSCYVNCKNLTTVPAWGSNVSNANSCYYGCSGITDISKIQANPMPSKITLKTDCVTGASDLIRSIFTSEWGGTKA